MLDGGRAHSGVYLWVLAFCRGLVAVSAFAALDEAVTQSKVGGNVSQADLTMQGHSAAMAEPAFPVPAKKMAMWLFIIADSATFAGCLFAYGFIRNATPNWPRPFHGIANVAVVMHVLLHSSLTMLFAARHAQVGDQTKAFRSTLITSLRRIMFAALHTRQWMG